MATYCFKCNTCGFKTNWHRRDIENAKGTCGHELVRDYRAENVAVGPAVGAIQRGMATDERADATVSAILPSSDDFLKKNGGNKRKANKEIKEWNERHEPADKKGNKYRPKEIV